MLIYLSFRLTKGLNQVVGPLGFWSLHDSTLELDPLLEHASQLDVQDFTSDTYLARVLRDQFEERLAGIRRLDRLIFYQVVGRPLRIHVRYLVKIVVLLGFLPSV